MARPTRSILAAFASLAVVSSLVLSTGCTGSKTSPGDGPKAGSPSQSAEIEHPEGDTSVTAELGGPGFEGGEGWQTADPEPLGDPRAIKGGALRTNMPGWPANLRMYGTGSNTYLNYLIRDMCYGSLVGMHPNTLEHIPGLCTHWSISEDKLTFRFRIDPKAHWSDGNPVTTNDIIATFRLIMDDTLQDPMTKLNFSKFEEPVAVSKYLLEVKCTEKHWLNFLIFSGFVPLPAHQLAELGVDTRVDYTGTEENEAAGEAPQIAEGDQQPGARYLDEYNFKYMAFNGPYMVRQQDIQDNKSVIITRRDRWWGEDRRQVEGLYNIDRVRFEVIRDDRLAFEKAMKGELDFYNVNTAKWWKEDLPPEQNEAVKKGWLVRSKVFTMHPNVYQGLALNMRQPPLDDVNVRKALFYLFDRVKMVEQFAYNEYDPIDSYFPGSNYESPENEKIRYNPEDAVKLLSEAGWTERGSDGILVKDGKRLSISMQYRSSGLEKYFTSYKEALKEVGVELKLEEYTPETQWKNMMDRQFQMASMAWATLFPNPRTQWQGELADVDGSNNITGLKSEKVDEILAEYEKEFDQEKRTVLLQQLDHELNEQVPYIHCWFLPCQRFVYWNKFGMPDYGLHKFGEYEEAFSLWWIDPEKEKALKELRTAGTALSPIPPVENRMWVEAKEEVAAKP